MSKSEGPSESLYGKSPSRIYPSIIYLVLFTSATPSSLPTSTDDLQLQLSKHAARQGHSMQVGQVFVFDALSEAPIPPHSHHELFGHFFLKMMKITLLSVEPRCVARIMTLETSPPEVVIFCFSYRKTALASFPCPTRIPTVQCAVEF